MAFPSINKLDLQTAWDQMRRAAARIKTAADDLAQRSSISVSDTLGYLNLLADDLVALDQATAVGGIAEYAKSQTVESGIDIVSEFTTLRGAISAMQALIAGALVNAGGRVEAFTIDGNKRYASVFLDASQLSGFKAALGALSQTIA